MFKRGGLFVFASIALAGGILASAATSANASLITFNFTGTVTLVESPLGGTFSLGQTLSGSYTFDSSIAATGASTSNFAVFNALTSFNFSIGGYSASSSGAPEIQVDNDPGAPNHDRYAIVSQASNGLTGPDVSSLALNTFGFRLDDSTDSVFSNALILPTALNFSDFTSSSFFVFFTNSAGALSIVSGTLTDVSAAPLPATLPLFASGLGALGLLGWRRKKNAARAA